MNTPFKQLPTHAQLRLPLVETIKEMGGGKPKDVCRALAEKLGIPPEIRDHTVLIKGRKVPTWDRRVRWVRQDLVEESYIPDDRYGYWDLTEEGDRHLRNCRPGVVVTLYETHLGHIFWAEAQSAAKMIQPGTLQLEFMSPPYPLLTEKAYGNRRGAEYIDWMLDHCSTFKPLLKEDGSLVLNLGEVWQAGIPCEDLYKERLLVNLCDRLGFHLAQHWYWENPCKIPSSEWVTVRRCRVNPSIEPIFWLSKTPHPKANNLKILRPYGERMLKLVAKGGEVRKQRPSGHGSARVEFARDNGGSIPHNLIVAPNSDSNSRYFRYCEERGLPKHPARFPRELPETFVRLCTDEGDPCADFFNGSGSFSEVCEELNRPYVGSEKSLTYNLGVPGRIGRASGFTDHTSRLLQESPELRLSSA